MNECTFRCRLGVERLDDRLTPSWSSLPPAAITIPAATAVTLNSGGDATGSATISGSEVDWYKFTAPAGGYTISATTPRSWLDTVIGLYSASGQRVASSDDISYFDRESRFTATLPAGTYYLGVTNYVGTWGGGYTWTVDGPAGAVTPPPGTTSGTTTAPPPSTSTGGFNITLRTTGLTAAERADFQRAADRWGQIITGDLPSASYNGLLVDDLLIDASAARIDGVGGVLGESAPDRFRAASGLPYHGSMEFDSADLAQLEATGQLYDVALHEMGHVLGIGSIWEQTGLLAGAGTSNPRFIGANATAAYNALFNTHATGVPVENSGGAGTEDAHWRESVFGNELMTGYLDPGSDPLSRVTVASLADLGYTVNMNAADAYSPP